MAQPQAAGFLKDIPLFSDLSPSDVQAVLRICIPVDLPSGETVCRQGAPGDCMYVIEQGTVAVTVQAQGGEPVQVASLGAGEIIGEMTLVDSQPRSASVIATTTVRAFRIDRADFDRLRSEMHPSVYKISRRIALTVCQRLRKVNQEVSRLVGGEAPLPEPQAPKRGQVRVASRIRGAKKKEEPRSFWSSLMNRVRG